MYEEYTLHIRFKIDIRYSSIYDKIPDSDIRYTYTKQKFQITIILVYDILNIVKLWFVLLE